MTAPLIHHIGILVEDIEDAIVRWQKATGYTFGPIERYRTNWWVDSSDETPHFHDARISFSIEGPPYIELMEFAGKGSHSRAQGEGFHHFGFVDQPDVEGRRRELAALGIGHDGEAQTEDGRVILWFTEKKHLDGIRLEYVSTDQQPIVPDDTPVPDQS